MDPSIERLSFSGLVRVTDDDGEMCTVVRFNRQRCQFVIPPGVLKALHPLDIPTTSTTVFPTVVTTPPASEVPVVVPEVTLPHVCIHCPHCSYPSAPVPTAGDSVDGHRTTRMWTHQDVIVIDSDEEEEEDPAEATSSSSSDFAAFLASLPPRKRARLGPV